MASITLNTMTKAEASVFFRDLQVLVSSFGVMERKPATFTLDDNGGAGPVTATFVDADAVSRTVTSQHKRTGGGW